MKHIWRYRDWPHFTWDSYALLKPLGSVRFNQRALIAQIRELGFDIQQRLACLSGLRLCDPHKSFQRMSGLWRTQGKV